MILDSATQDTNQRKVSTQQSNTPEHISGSKFTENNLRNIGHSSMASKSQPLSIHRCRLGPLMSALAVECVGSFLFALTVPLSVKYNPEMSSIGIGFFLTSLVFTFGYISQGHFNPMITTSLWLSMPANEIGNTFSRGHFLLYVIAQMLGGALGSLYCMLIEGKDFIVPSMGENFTQLVRGFLEETIFIFLLCSAALHANSKKKWKSNFYGFAIGFVVLCGGLSKDSVTNSSFNVAVTTPLTFLRLFSLKNSMLNQLLNLVVYWLSGIMGSVVASILYLLIENAEE